MIDLVNNETLIKKSTGWRIIDWRELIYHRDLLFFLTIREVKAKYAQSVLGISWAIIQPLFTALMFTIVFGKLVRVNSNGIPYILITKVYFPRIYIPISAAIARLLDLSIGFLVLIPLMIIYARAPSWNLLLLPLLLVILFTASMSLCIFFSAMAVQYRDVKHAMSFFLQLFMYSTPVVYSTHSIAKEWQNWYALNPIVGVIEGFRSIFLNLPIPWTWIVIGFFISVLMFFFSTAYFRHKENIFADVV
jgi:lipopolysaccharide transport system permease protein